MKTLLSGIFLALFTASMFGASIPGTVVSAPITSGNTANTISIGDSTEMQGTPKSVADSTARDAIPAARRTEGMECFLTSTKEVYKLVGGIDNTNWTRVMTLSPSFTGFSVSNGTDHVDIFPTGIYTPGSNSAGVFYGSAAGLTGIPSSSNSIPVVNVTASPFNAVGDTNTDNTAAIQAALYYAATNTTSRVVYLPPGEYKITSALIWPQSIGLKLVGAGGTEGLAPINAPTKIRQVTAGANGITGTANNPGARTWSHSTFQDFALIGSTNTSGIGIEIGDIGGNHNGTVMMARFDRVTVAGFKIGIKQWDSVSPTFYQTACTYNTNAAYFNHIVDSGLWLDCWGGWSTNCWAMWDEGSGLQNQIIGGAWGNCDNGWHYDDSTFYRSGGNVESLYKAVNVFTNYNSYSEDGVYYLLVSGNANIPVYRYTSSDAQNLALVHINNPFITGGWAQTQAIFSCEGPRLNLPHIDSGGGDGAVLSSRTNVIAVAATVGGPYTNWYGISGVDLNTPNKFTGNQTVVGRTYLQSGDTYVGVGWGADSAANTVTASAVKHGAISVPAYVDAGATRNVGSLSYDADAANQILYLGGNPSLFGMTELRLQTATAVGQVASTRWTINSSGNLVGAFGGHMYGNGQFLTNDAGAAFGSGGSGTGLSNITDSAYTVNVRSNLNVGGDLNVSGNSTWANAVVTNLAILSITTWNLVATNLYGNGVGVTNIQATNIAGSFGSLTGSVQVVTPSITLNGSTRTTWPAAGSNPGFDTVQSGANVTATMQVGTGASLAPTGSGTVTANALSGTPATSLVAAMATNDSRSIALSAASNYLGTVVGANAFRLHTTPGVGDGPIMVLATNSQELGIGSTAAFMSNGIIWGLQAANISALGTISAATHFNGYGSAVMPGKILGTDTSTNFVTYDAGPGIGVTAGTIYSTNVPSANITVGAFNTVLFQGTNTAEVGFKSYGDAMEVFLMADAAPYFEWSALAGVTSLGSSTYPWSNGVFAGTVTAPIIQGPITIKANSYNTNGSYISGDGEVFSNNLGSVTISGGTLKATNTSGAMFNTPTNAPTDAYVLTATGTSGASAWKVASGGSSTKSIVMSIDGQGSAISTGLKGYLYIPAGVTISAATMLADQTGSIIINVWRCTYSQFDAGATHPVVGDKLTASAPPTITSTYKSTDSTLSGWNTTLSAGDVLAFNVDSCTTITKISLTLTVQ